MQRKGLKSKQRQTLLSSRELQLNFEADQLREAKDLLAHAKKEVLSETAYKDQVFKDAEIAIRKTQTEAEQLAQSTLSQQRGQAEQMVQTLQGRIQTSEQALALERTEKSEAQSELASSKVLCCKESALMIERYDALVVAGREAERKSKEEIESLIVAGREAERRLVAASDCERTLKGIIEEKGAVTS